MRDSPRESMAELSSMTLPAEHGGSSSGSEIHDGNPQRAFGECARFPMGCLRKDPRKGMEGRSRGFAER